MGAAFSPQECVRSLSSGDRTDLGKAITFIESVRLEDHRVADEILRLCLPKSGKSIRIGITGPPGTGKSSLIESLGQFLIQEHKRRVAVLAIDPTSHNSKGSILGDKTRMTKLAAHLQAFVRPSPNSGSPGGVSFRTREAIIICEAAGYDTILIETVGVGQSQTSVHSMVDFTILLSLAGGGDSLQGIKRGIMEIADLIVITKADGNNVAAARMALLKYKTALGYHRKKKSNWESRVLTCSVLRSEGLSDIWQNVQQYLKVTRENDYFYTNRRQQVSRWLREKIHEKTDRALNLFMEKMENTPQYGRWQEDLLSGKLSSNQLIQRLWEQYRDEAL